LADFHADALAVGKVSLLPTIWARLVGLDWKGLLGMARKFDRVEQVLQTSVLSGNDPWLHSRAILPFWDRGLAA
jgi:hypothetical protein